MPLCGGGATRFVGPPWAGVEMEPYLEKAERTGRLIVPSKLGAIPDETYTLTLTELSLAGNMLKTVDARLASVRHASAAQHAHPRAMMLKCWRGAFAVAIIARYITRFFESLLN